MPTDSACEADIPAGRFTDYRVPTPGLRGIFATENKWQKRLDVEAALAAAQAEAHVIPRAAADEIVTVAAKLDNLDLARVVAGMAETSHPLMSLVEELSRAVGEEHGGWVHWGATTQNIIQTADVLVLREAHQILLSLMGRILHAAGELAERTAETVMPGRTHGQHAVPITFGYKVAVWIDELLRHARRLERLEGDVFTAMAGGAVGTFAAVGAEGPDVQNRVATRLGLVSMPVASRSIADPFAEYVAVLGLLAGTVGKIAREVTELMKPEFAEAREPIPDGVVGSSTMPHKRNPQLSQDILTISAQIRNLVPLSLEAMLHDHEVDGSATAMMEHAVESSVILSGDLLIRLAVILEGLTVDEARMRQNLALTHGLINSEAIMMALAPSLGRQLAHDIVYEAAQHAAKTGEDFLSVLRADERLTRHVSDHQLAEVLDPRSHVGLSADIARRQAGDAVTASARWADSMT
ncbi:class-II fumarase/aspartase family protein [Parasphingorhabdus pacifica]